METASESRAGQCELRSPLGVMVCLLLLSTSLRQHILAAQRTSSVIAVSFLSHVVARDSVQLPTR